jgi:Cu/Ag efflux pump CusA
MTLSDIFAAIVALATVVSVVVATLAVGGLVLDPSNTDARTLLTYALPVAIVGGVICIRVRACRLRILAWLIPF